MKRRGKLGRELCGAIVAACAVAAGCSAPPWQIGRPLDGKKSIPPTAALPTPAEARAAAARARAAGQPVLELTALAALEREWRLDAVLRAEPTIAENGRLAELLAARAAALHALGRAIPESRDLDAVARLDPARGGKLLPERAAAAVAAGDAWKAIGARDDARAAFALAAFLGGVAPHAPPAAAGFWPPAPSQLPADVDGWVLAGPALSARLLPLAAAFPAILDDVPRALRWAELLLDEDATSPDVLALVATIFGRAGRFGGTERMLMELAYHTPDRATGLARGAAVWERVGRPREACAQWIRAARWRDQPEDPLWVNAITCARHDPGAGDWQEIRAYVLGRARPERRDAVAAALDGLPPPAAMVPDAGADGPPSPG
jgi:tetratricopeptide (TPR) repeat protein